MSTARSRSKTVPRILFSLQDAEFLMCKQAVPSNALCNWDYLQLPESGMYVFQGGRRTTDEGVILLHSLSGPFPSALRLSAGYSHSLQPPPANMSENSVLG